jgi:hypothetical protein
VLSTKADDNSKGQVMANIRTTLRAVPWWEMKHTLRDANQIAHVLAELAVKQSVNMVWFSNPSDYIRESLRADIFTLTISL